MQLLNVSQEELQLKKQLIEKMANMDKTCFGHVVKLTNNMEKLTGSIADGFAFLRQMMCPGPSVMPHYMTPQVNSSIYPNTACIPGSNSTCK